VAVSEDKLNKNHISLNVYPNITQILVSKIKLNLLMTIIM